MNSGWGTAIGAGAGALGATGMWAIGRLALKKKLNKCNGDPNCVQQVQQEIKEYRNKMLISGSLLALSAGTVGSVNDSINKSNANFNPDAAAQDYLEKTMPNREAKIKDYLDNSSRLALGMPVIPNVTPNTPLSKNW